MMDHRLTRTVLARVSRRQKIALRRWARQAKTDVSVVVRDLVEERLSREAAARAVKSAQAVESAQDSNADLVGVAA